MKYRCLESIGLPELSVGDVYVGRHTKETGMLEIRVGNEVLECFSSRFEALGTWPERGCSCSTSSMPPCGYCEGGGWCTEHSELRRDCGCEWDEWEEY